MVIGAESAILPTRIRELENGIGFGGALVDPHWLYAEFFNVQSYSVLSATAILFKFMAISIKMKRKNILETCLIPACGDPWSFLSIKNGAPTSLSVPSAGHDKREGVVELRKIVK